MSTPIYYIKSGNLDFGDKKIFEELEFYLYPGDKISLVGKNGCGKSSLMKVITGEYELDGGQLFIDPRVKIGYLKQDIDKNISGSVYDYILENLSFEEFKFKADIILEGLDLDGNLNLENLSGGQKRRAFLARALTISPDILLLDEPTNHLDIKSVLWLENYINNYSGSVILISHDRKFLENTSNKIWWLDRGCLKTSNKGFKHFFDWQEEVIKEEENELIKLNKKLATENIWLSQGVTARRKRNQKRLANLWRIRDEQRNFQENLRKSKQKLSVEIDENEKKSKLIIEAENLSAGFDQKVIFENFNIIVKKGEKIGIIGPNGSGKSTLIKTLLGKIKPISGKLRIGKNIDITYFDQHRDDLDTSKTLCETLCPAGGDNVFLKDRVMHAAGYLKQFLFDPKLLHTKVSNLSGGERNRLLLAKSLIEPGNFMVLDEPTNDLDMDTLDLLLEILSDFSGTLIVVSHDRDFLDKLVTRTLVFTEDKKIEDFIGGYEDYLKFYKKEEKETTEKQEKKIEKIKTPSNNISYKYIHLQKTLPIDIESLESKIKHLEESLSDPMLFTKDASKFTKLSKELENKKAELESLFEKWLEVEEHISNRTSSAS